MTPPSLASRLRAMAEEFDCMLDRPSEEVSLAAANRLRGLAQELEDYARGGTLEMCESRELPRRARSYTVHHELKTWPDYYKHLVDGTKNFEYRRNDRGFNVGDVLLLREWEPAFEKYTGREMRRRVTYILAVSREFVVMSLGVDGGHSEHPSLTTPANPKDDLAIGESVIGWDVRGYQPHGWQPIASVPNDRWVWLGRAQPDGKPDAPTVSAFKWDESRKHWFAGLGWWHQIPGRFTHWAEMTQPPSPVAAPPERSDG